MTARRELELKVWNLTEEEILNKTLFDLLGKDEVIYKFHEAFKRMEVEQRYDEFYLKKIGYRKVIDYISTLREIDGQVGTKFYKVEHNAFMTGLLREAGIIDGVMFMALYPKFMKKLTLAARSYLGLFLHEGEVRDGKGHVVYVLESESGIATREAAKNLPVPLGHWEGGREKITKLKRRKDSK